MRLLARQELMMMMIKIDTLHIHYLENFWTKLISDKNKCLELSATKIFTVHYKVHTFFLDSSMTKQELELGLACSFNHLKENIMRINSNS